MWYTISVDRQVTGYPTGLHSETYRSLLWKHIPVSSIPFPYIFLARTGVSGVIPVLLLYLDIIKDLVKYYCAAAFAGNYVCVFVNDVYTNDYATKGAVLKYRDHALAWCLKQI